MTLKEVYEKFKTNLIIEEEGTEKTTFGSMHPHLWMDRKVTGIDYLPCGKIKVRIVSEE